MSDSPTQLLGDLHTSRTPPVTRDTEPPPLPFSVPILDFRACFSLCQGSQQAKRSHHSTIFSCSASSSHPWNNSWRNSKRCKPFRLSRCDGRRGSSSQGA